MPSTHDEGRTETTRLLAAEAEPIGETAYDVWLRHAELIHQLRSVHAGLALSTELLLETALHTGADGPGGRPDAPDTYRLLRLQAGEVAHLGRLLEASLPADPELMGGPPEQEPQADLAEVVDLAVGVARLHGQLVTWTGTPITRRVPARPVREVLQVVLENARKHATGSRVDLEVVQDGDAVLVRVHDHGPGLTGPPRAPAAGHGLGLRIAAEAAEEIGARLTVEASEEGASFLLVLPAPQDATQGEVEAGGVPWSACPA